MPAIILQFISQASFSNSYPQPSSSNSYPQPSNPLSPPQQNELVPASLLPPPFTTPPKLLPVDEVMQDYPGNDIFTLQRLTTALARDAIFGKQALVRSQVPTMSDVTFEAIWAKCCCSLSKFCIQLPRRFYIVCQLLLL